MKKLTANDPETHSADGLAENVEKLKALFPEALTEGKIDFEVLKQLLAGAVDERDEKYGLNWHGKRRARQLALTPSIGTLRPAPVDSVDWDTTQNLMIEGDNLEVLKLLHKSYAGRVKLIYIDPPYNTGTDFVYPDNFQDNIRNYLELTGQVEGGAKISSNTEASGRFHTDWLNMMYPRLKVAYQLLSRHGLIFINIDDNESARVRMILDEIFGEENFSAAIVWKKGSGSSDSDFSFTHDQIIVYRKNDAASLGKVRQGEQQLASYQNPDDDPRGDWTSSDYTSKWTKEERPNLWYPIVNPNTKKDCLPPPHRTWAYSREETDRNIQSNLLWWGKDGVNDRPRFKRFMAKTGGLRVPRSWWDHVETNEDGVKTFRELGFSKADFPHPKPVGLIREIIRIGAPDGGIVLDFFAGSGTTGHAVMLAAKEESVSLNFILIQFPEPLTGSNFDTLFAVCVERLRRAGTFLAKDQEPSEADTGFRVFKLDSTNIRAWEPDRDNLDQTLLDSVEHLKDGRTEADILYELLLKLGLDLCVPIEKRPIAGKDVHSVGGGVLLACLAERVGREDVEPLALGIVAWHKSLAPVGATTCVFRDNAFADDVAKTNMAAILEQHGIENVRSV